MPDVVGGQRVERVCMPRGARAGVALFGADTRVEHTVSPSVDLGEAAAHRARRVPAVPLHGDQLGDSLEQIEPLLGPVARVRLDGDAVFLAFFGRDSLISGIQALPDTPQRLTDGLTPSARGLLAEMASVASALWFGAADAYIDRVMEIANVSRITMTNAVFDDNERQRWLAKPQPGADSRFAGVLRFDPILRNWPAAAMRLSGSVRPGTTPSRSRHCCSA